MSGPSEQSDEGNRRKAAFSDALQRAAVTLGIGGYLYRLPRQWVDYDAQKRQFVRVPTLPPSALPTPNSTVPNRSGTPNPTRSRYNLTRLHATGGIGRIWLARDADLGRDKAAGNLVVQKIAQGLALEA